MKELRQYFGSEMLGILRFSCYFGAFLILWNAYQPPRLMMCFQIHCKGVCHELTGIAFSRRKFFYQVSSSKQEL